MPDRCHGRIAAADVMLSHETLEAADVLQRHSAPFNRVVNCRCLLAQAAFVRSDKLTVTSLPTQGAVPVGEACRPMLLVVYGVIAIVMG